MLRKMIFLFIFVCLTKNLKKNQLKTKLLKNDSHIVKLFNFYIDELK